VPVPDGCPVHLFAGFAVRQARGPGEPGGPPAPAAATSGKQVFGGRGFSRRQAVVSCLAEAAESLAIRHRGDEDLVVAPYRDVADSALHPSALLHFSPRQYDERAERNRAQRGHNWIPPRFDEGRPVGWIEARAVTGGAPRLLPAGFCFQGYREQDGAPDFCAANSNGCASAPSFGEAVVRGFAELAERDAAAIWWYNRVRRPDIDLETVPHEAVQVLRRWLAERGRQVHALDLTTDLEVPVVAAVSSDAEGGQVIFGFGAHPEPGIALSGALTEMQQIAASAAMIAEHYGATRDPATDPSALALLEWVQSATLESQPHLAPAERPSVSYESWCRRFPEPAGLLQLKKR